MTGVAFECYVLQGLTEMEKVFLYDEESAVDWALMRVGPLVTQVTIEAGTAGDVSTFAIRHFRLEVGKLHDSGWSCWKDGDRVNTRSLDVLFADPPARLFSEGLV